MRIIVILASMVLLSGCRTTKESPHTDLQAFQKQARSFQSVITLPEFETSPGQLGQSISNAIAEANAALDRIGALKPSQATFANTVRALDDIGWRAGLVANRVYLIKETSPDAALREAGTRLIKVFEEWAVGLDYREDVYAAVKAYADTRPQLEGEDARLLEHTLRDYRRAGLQLPKAGRDEVERLRKELSALSTDFDSNITRAVRPMKFTRAELDGVPESFLNQPGVKTGEDEFTVMVNVTWHFITVMDNARHGETRKRLLVARETLAKEENAPLLNKILLLRQSIAGKLGYATWADYVIEPRMAQNAATARKFLTDLKAGLQPKFAAEVEALREIKAAETGDPGAQIHLWDWRYYQNQLKKQKYTVDTEALRVYFPYEQTLQGMFTVYETIFRLKFREVEPPQKWVGDLKLYAVSDSLTGEPLGLFYLDMFPREGKYNHFAQFGLIDGKRLPGGKYQRPVVALICNFPPPEPGKPSLLSHRDVETLFHEFGHAMHSIMTRAAYSRFSGTSVPRDFVEAPSQMLENWVWDKKVLDSFAADYRDPSKKIPAETIVQLEEARLATIGAHYRRQLAFGLLDLGLHSGFKEGDDAVELSNAIISDTFFPVAEGTAFVAFFGHLTGYDAGYYGYAWADAIAADMATAFENSPAGYYDQQVGLRLREEIYAPGNARDVNDSIRVFLGRERSLNPFLKALGIGN